MLHLAGPDQILDRARHVLDRHAGIAEVVKRVASELGATPTQIALAWVLAQPGVTSPIVGARTLAQLDDNLGALRLELSPSHVTELGRASAFELGFPYEMLVRDMTRTVMFGNAQVAGLNA